MKIAAITRYKNGCLFEALQKLGWTQKDLSKRSGLGIHVIGPLCNLQVRPSDEQAIAVQKAFGEGGLFLDLEQTWPEDYQPLGKRKAVVVQVAEVDYRQLGYEYYQQLLPDVDDRKNLLLDTIAEVFEFLTPAEQELISLNYIEGKSIEEISSLHNVVIQTTRNRIDHALKHLRWLISQKKGLEEVYDFSPNGDGWGVMRQIIDAPAPFKKAHLTEVDQLTKVV